MRHSLVFIYKLIIQHFKTEFNEKKINRSKAVFEIEIF
ncbi:hypothetical protein FM106_14510 [Brachybacterium faecium]|nr:hypothetical protein FM106_14510 [Brachybacterium faecium]